MPFSPDLRNPPVRSEALAAHSGVHHWWLQRVTAVALIPLSLWFVTGYSILALLSP
jgi:succinate dehydrogenase / fumarate reductase membrane anchor subunit